MSYFEKFYLHPIGHEDYVKFLDLEKEFLNITSKAYDLKNEFYFLKEEPDYISKNLGNLYNNINLLNNELESLNKKTNEFNTAVSYAEFHSITEFINKLNTFTEEYKQLKEEVECLNEINARKEKFKNLINDIEELIQKYHFIEVEIFYKENELTKESINIKECLISKMTITDNDNDFKNQVADIKKQLEELNTQINKIFKNADNLKLVLSDQEIKNLENQFIKRN